MSFRTPKHDFTFKRNETDDEEKKIDAKLATICTYWTTWVHDTWRWLLMWAILSPFTRICCKICFGVASAKINQFAKFLFIYIVEAYIYIYITQELIKPKSNKSRNGITHTCIQESFTDFWVINLLTLAGIINNMNKKEKLTVFFYRQKKKKNLLCFPPRLSTAWTKCWWSSGVHRRRGCSDLLYCLTPILWEIFIFWVSLNFIYEVQQQQQVKLNTRATHKYK